VWSLALDASRLADIWCSFLSSWLASPSIGAVLPFVLQFVTERDCDERKSCRIWATSNVRWCR
jgi:hypothetical protein